MNGRENFMIVQQSSKNNYFYSRFFATKTERIASIQKLFNQSKTFCFSSDNLFGSAKPRKNWATWYAPSTVLLQNVASLNENVT